MAYILYEGPSQLDGEPIVVIMTKGGKSKNEKTGAMAQVYILRSDMPPLEATKSGSDVSICGNCPHRPISGGSCYVNVAQGPRAVYDAYKRGVYTHQWSWMQFRGITIRLGAYGDPSAVNVNLWKNLTDMAKSWTGYTHQALQHPEYQHLIQASADTEQEALELQRLGWKTFRVKRPEDPLMPGELMCPNVTHGIKCESCNLCNGRKANIAIDVHGLSHKITKFKQWSMQPI